MRGYVLYKLNTYTLIGGGRERGREREGGREGERGDKGGREGETHMYTVYMYL